MELQDRRKWRFMPTADDRWHWVSVDDGREVLSSEAFATLKECVEDAKSHGYVVVVPERRRHV